ncbi:hypothetical protein ZOSMA_43G00470 [Zostera marina]|uniref:F-box domain-containing protein n=1 Tax=Zostera marina TaxID=29655 RepID=A0A0K9P3Q1_ZOSMR|nr:hypothetical protein ZOSMA_43G00470 [Zostera marina]
MDNSDSQPRYYTRALGRKRVVSDTLDVLVTLSEQGSGSSCTKRRHCQIASSRLQSMPQEVLVQILCGVNQSDLSRLIFVSKAIKEAALLAKETYFAFRTPKREAEFENGGDQASPIVPNAPKVDRKQTKYKSWFDIAVVLFPGDEEEDKEEEDAA